MRTQSIVVCLSILLTMLAGMVQAYDNEVWKSGDTYFWKIDGTQAGSSSELHTAINNSLAQGRTVHVLTGGTLNGTISIPSWNVTIYFHNNILYKNFNGYGISNGWDGLKLYDLRMMGGENMGIRSSRGSNLYFENIHIYGGGIGLRIDSHPNRPYDNWIYNVHVQDSKFENTAGHGLETYGIDGFQGWGLVARNCGESGVLLNKTINGTLGTVNSYRCPREGGYAGLRLANDCDNISINNLYATECGRGFFVLSGSQNINLDNAAIVGSKDAAIWLENTPNTTVQNGCYDVGWVSVAGAGSYSNANQSSSCNGAEEIKWGIMRSRHSEMCLRVENSSTANGARVVQEPCNGSWSSQQFQLVEGADTGWFQIIARHSNKCLRDTGTIIQETCNASFWSQQFEVNSVGTGWRTIKNRGTGQCFRIDNGSVSSGAYIVPDSCDASYWTEQFMLMDY